MFVFHFARLTARKTLWLGLAGLLAISCWAQDTTPQSSEPATPAAQPSAPQASEPADAQPSTPAQSTMPQEKIPMPPLTPLPQAPAPQHNAAHLYSGDQNYAKPFSGFPNFIAPYTVRHVPQPNLVNSSMTDTLFHDGQMYLSINDAVAMALENNLDITLQRYNLSIADTDLLLTSTGQRHAAWRTAWRKAHKAANWERFQPGARAAPPPEPRHRRRRHRDWRGRRRRRRCRHCRSTLGFGPPIDNFDPSSRGRYKGNAPRFLRPARHLSACPP